LKYSLAPFAEVRELKYSHWAVPENRVGSLDHSVEELDGLGAFVKDFPALRNISVLAYDSLSSWAVLFGADSIDWQVYLDSFFSCCVHNPL
jgi:hypothetical protein